MLESFPLPAFIRKSLGPITEEWRQFAETLAPSGTSDLVLRDHIHQILFFIADDIESNQTTAQQEDKSRGENDKEKSPGIIHAVLRHEAGFNLVQLISEYRALRATVTNLWIKTKPVLTHSEALQLIRFNEAIDQLLTQSVAGFLETITDVRLGSSDSLRQDVPK